MVTAARNELLALSPHQLASTPSERMAVDQLPPQLLAKFEDCLVRSVTEAEVTRAFRRVAEMLVQELPQVDAGLAERLAQPLTELFCSAALATKPDS